MILRPPTPTDYPAIAAVVRAAFDNSRSDEAAIIAGVRAEGAALVERVAVRDGAIIGHVLFSRMTCDPPALFVGLGPVAVAPDHQGRGVGDALCRAGLEACRALGAAGAVVLGHPDYYPRFGFSHAAAAPLRSRYGAYPAFMAMALTPGALDAPRAIAYPAAFG